MIERRDMENKITPEKKVALNKSAAKFLAKSLWNGIHHALLAMVMLFIVVMVNLTYFNNDSVAGMFGSFAVGFFIIRRVLRTSSEDFKKFNEEVKSIIKE